MLLPLNLPGEAVVALSTVGSLPHAHGNSASKCYKQLIWEQPGFNEVAFVQDNSKAVGDSQ